MANQDAKSHLCKVTSLRRWPDVRCFLSLGGLRIQIAEIPSRVDPCASSHGSSAEASGVRSRRQLAEIRRRDADRDTRAYRQFSAIAGVVPPRQLQPRQTGAKRHHAGVSRDLHSSRFSAELPDRGRVRGVRRQSCLRAPEHDVPRWRWPNDPHCVSSSVGHCRECPGRGRSPA